jgi:hypothetical protein
MNKSFLMVRDIDQVILGVMWQDDPDDGPVLDIQADPPQGVSLIYWPGEFERSGYPETYVASFIDGAIKWADGEDFAAQCARKAEAISSSCADAILSGFVSSALGEPHTYPAKPNDQINLAGLVMRSFYPSVGPEWSRPFWCMDASDVWAYRMHTAAQIQQVGDDSIDANLIQRSINEQLQAQILAAKTPADLAEINWPSEAP